MVSYASWVMMHAYSLGTVSFVNDMEDFIVIHVDTPHGYIRMEVDTDINYTVIGMHNVVLAELRGEVLHLKPEARLAKNISLELERVFGGGDVSA